MVSLHGVAGRLLIEELAIGELGDFIEDDEPGHSV